MLTNGPSEWHSSVASLCCMEETPVGKFVAAVEQYQKARDEQHRDFATREPDSLEDADRGVRIALKELIADL